MSLISCLAALPVYAADIEDEPVPDEPVEPYSYTEDYMIDFQIAAGTADVTVDYTGIPGLTTRAEISVISATNANFRGSSTLSAEGNNKENKNMKCKFMKGFLLITALILSLYFACFAVNAENSEISKELAADIITRTEEAYDALDIMRYDFDNVPSLVSRIKEIPYEVRSENGYEHYEHMNWVFETEQGSRNGWFEFLNKTFTEEMADIIINESDLIFKDGKAYLPTDPSQLMDNVVALHEQERTTPLTERITEIVANGSGEYTVTYLGWSKFNPEKYMTEQDETGRIVIVGEPEVLSIKVRKEGSDYKVCDYDSVFFLKNDNSGLSASGMRHYRFIEENPQSGDSAVYITAAAGVIALCCAVVCKKKLRKV